MAFSVDPWANRVAAGTPGEFPTHPLRADPCQCVFIGERDLLASSGECPLYIAGTDAAGPLHLGHLFCFMAGLCLAEHAGGRFVVSINELESGLSRGIPVRLALRNAADLRRAMEDQGLAVHSRLCDAELAYAAPCLFRWLHTERRQLTDEIYGGISEADLLGICSMLLTPAFLARPAERLVCAVYGYDEACHVELIHRLYQDGGFERWLRDQCGRHLPAFTYVLTHLLSAPGARFKMSKSRPSDAVPWDAPAEGGAPYAAMFGRLHDFARERAPLAAASPLGRAAARHAGVGHAVL